MTADPSAPAQLDFASELEMTRVGLHLGGARDAVLPLGQWRTWAPGQYLCHQGRLEGELHVLLEGRAQYPGGVLGPGGHAGELGFLLGIPRATHLVAIDRCRTWSVAASALQTDAAAATRLVTSLLRELPHRLGKFRPRPLTGERFCDHEHPAIVATARALRSAHAHDTARAIWQFVRMLPYRFGPWWERASDTLRAGWGMCTTKANLQVALWRAAGLEAGFVEIQGEAALLHPLIPPRWHHVIRPRIRHYMGAVLLEGRWHVADGAFTDPTILQLARSFPRVREVMPCDFAPGKPFFPIAHILDRDPFAVSVIADLDEPMARRSSHDSEQFELLNIVVDRLQPGIGDESAWIRRAEALLPHDPQGALRAALAAAASIAGDLLEHLQAPA